jgi:hypothetical protein
MIDLFGSVEAEYTAGDSVGQAAGPRDPQVRAGPRRGSFGRVRSV